LWGSGAVIHERFSKSSARICTSRGESDGETATFGGYRNVDGEVVAFRTTIRDALGPATIEVRDVKFNGPIPATAFEPATK
jgi:hypothetical protein